MNDSLAILGRQPALGLAELESLYGKKVTPLGVYAARLSMPPESVSFSRLGGTVKLCRVLATLDATNWKELETALLQAVPKYAETLAATGKLHLGLSAYGLRVTPRHLLATGLSLKKALARQTGRTIRVVPNQEIALNSAQVIHNNLIGPNGLELVLVRTGDAQTILAQTISEQDIEDYTLRDRGRPKRDARVGMLPPKLAQIIINLAVGNLPADQPTTPHASLGRTMLDPFCGTGVILQEALLMGYEAHGSDLDQRMYDYTLANLTWLERRFPGQLPDYGLARGDATTMQWETSEFHGSDAVRRPLSIDFVASETYLGRPFTSAPAAATLTQTIGDCNLIIQKFLRNIRSQIKPGTRLCLAAPAWQIRPGNFRRLPLIDQIEDLGYNRVRFEHIRDEDLLYYRADQIVARQMLVLTKQ